MMPIVKRELRLLAKEKSFGLLVFIELLLLVSSNLFGIGYLLIASPQDARGADFSPLVSVGVVTETPYPFQKLSEKSRANMIFYDSFPKAHADFLDGSIDAVVFGSIPMELSQSELSVFIPGNSPKANLIRITMRSLMQDLETLVRDDKASTLAPQIRPLYIGNDVPFSPTSEIYFIFTLPLLLFLPALISGSLIIDNITEEIEKKTLINLRRAPLSDQEIISQKILAVVLVAFLQCLAWLAIIGATQVSVENVFWIVMAFSLYAAAFSCFGAILALLSRSQRVAQVLFTTSSIAALGFFSPVINDYPILVSNSPAYIVTYLSTGSNPLGVAPQLLLLLVLAGLAAGAAMRLAGELKKA